MRRRVMMLLEEMPDAERVKRGNVLFKTRVRDIEDRSRSSCMTMSR